MFTMDTSILYWVNGHHTPFLDHFFWELSLPIDYDSDSATGEDLDYAIVTSLGYSF